MKTFINSVLFLSIIFIFTACGGGGSSDSRQSSNQANPSQGGSNALSSNDTIDINGTSGNTSQEVQSNQTNITVITNYISNSTNTISSPDYILPPMPDKELNDSTLLGIDSNENGVRDDVEIWISENYATYKLCRTIIKNYIDPEYGNSTFGEIYCDGEEAPYHPIVREIAMQYARAFQIVIQDSSRALEFQKLISYSIECEMYFKLHADGYNEPLVVPKFYDVDIDDIQFNTEERFRAYLKYDGNLGGHVFTLLAFDKMRGACDFDVDKLLGK